MSPFLKPRAAAPLELVNLAATSTPPCPGHRDVAGMRNEAAPTGSTPSAIARSPAILPHLELVAPRKKAAEPNLLNQAAKFELSFLESLLCHGISVIENDAQKILRSMPNDILFRLDNTRYNANDRKHGLKLLWLELYAL
ncbi:hypothetical protein VPH35_072328 [Triticum aestivum]